MGTFETLKANRAFENGRSQVSLRSFAHAAQRERAQGMAMQSRCAIVSVFGFLLLLTGCVGFGVTSPPDPAAKLEDASYLINKANRPVPAERLIWGAVQTYQERNDLFGLANAYRMYAYFLTSEPVGSESWRRGFRQNGFIDGTTFDERYAKAIEYLDRAEKLIGDAGHFDVLANIYFLKGQAFHALGDRDSACNSLDRSLEVNLENIRRNPNADVQSPGFASFADAVALRKTQWDCMRASEPFRTIAILKPDEPIEYDYVNFGALAFDPFSVVKGMMDRKSRELSQDLVSRSPSLARLMTDSLADELRSEGYNTISVKVTHEKPSLLIRDYASISVNADAVLDVAILPPQFLTDGNSDLEPSLRTAFRLVSLHSREILYMKFFDYGYSFPRAGEFVHVPFTRRTSFKNIGALSNSPDAAIAALREGVRLIAAQVGRDLRK